MKRYWEIIADNLSKAGSSSGCVSAVTSEGRIIWGADAHRNDGRRFVVHADDKLTAFPRIGKGDLASPVELTSQKLTGEAACARGGPGITGTKT